jgi:hypothetical protein
VQESCVILQSEKFVVFENWIMYEFRGTRDNKRIIKLEFQMEIERSPPHNLNLLRKKQFFRFFVKSNFESFKTKNGEKLRQKLQKY